MITTITSLSLPTTTTLRPTKNPPLTTAALMAGPDLSRSYSPRVIKTSAAARTNVTRTPGPGVSRNRDPHVTRKSAPDVSTMSAFPMRTYDPEVSRTSGAREVGRVRANISFAPGTTFFNRSRVKSHGPVKPKTAVSLRPLTSVDGMPQLRFSLPRTTFPRLQFLTTIHNNYITSCDVTQPYYTPSPSPTFANKKIISRKEGGLVVSTHSPSLKAQQDSTQEQEAEAISARQEELPDESSSSPGLKQRSMSAQVPAQSSEEKNSESLELSPVELKETPTGSAKRLLRREKHAHARLFPPANPFRSGREDTNGSISRNGSGRDIKKQLGSGRHAHLKESDDRPNSALIREATLYDLNHQGPVERPLEGVLPSPDRKTYSHHCRRLVIKKDRAKRPPTDDCELMITPRDKLHDDSAKTTHRKVKVKG